MTGFSFSNQFALRTAAAFVALFTLTASLQAQPKIATVNLKKLFESYYRTEQADAVLKDNAAEAGKVEKGMFEEHQRYTEEYKKLVDGSNDQAVSADERERRKKAAEAKLVEIKETEKSITQFRREAATRIDEQKRRLRDGIVETIREAIDGKAKAGNYNLVLDTSGESRDNWTPLVLYTDGQHDLTDEILKELNAGAPPEKVERPTTAPAAPPAKPAKPERKR